MISIVIPTLNEETFLPNLLESVAAQTVKDFEVIVVDGNSKDTTVSVALSFGSKIPQLSVIECTKASLPMQRNRGAREAKGDWLLFIDADSVLFPHFIDRVTRYIRSQKPLFFTTWMSPDSNEPRDANISALANLIIGTSSYVNRPIGTGPLTGVRKDIFEKIGGYDVSHRYNEDADFNLRMAKENIVFHVIPETLYIWSLRRLRQQGTLKVLQQYIVSGLPLLLFKRPLKYMPGYVMGGQLYKKKKKSFSSTFIKQYEIKLKNLMKEFLE